MRDDGIITRIILTVAMYTLFAFSYVYMGCKWVVDTLRGKR